MHQPFARLLTCIFLLPSACGENEIGGTPAATAATAEDDAAGSSPTPPGAAVTLETSPTTSATTGEPSEPSPPPAGSAGALPAAMPTTPDVEAAAAPEEAERDSQAGVDPLSSDPLSSDRDAFWGESRCAALAALFCDDFEAATIADVWEKQGPGTVEIDTSRRARGDSSLHVHTEGNGFAYLRLRSIFPTAENRYYGRMFVRFDALPSKPAWAHWTIAEAAGSGDGSLIRVGGQLDSEHNRFGIGSDRGPTGDWTWLDDDPEGMGQTVPEDEWLCIEWLHDGADDHTRFFWDAVEHPSLATTATEHGGADTAYAMPNFESVWIGFWLYQGGSTPDHFDLWIDEVAFDNERIGCVR